MTFSTILRLRAFSDMVFVCCGPNQGLNDNNVAFIPQFHWFCTQVNQNILYQQQSSENTQDVHWSDMSEDGRENQNRKKFTMPEQLYNLEHLQNLAYFPGSSSRHLGRIPIKTEFNLKSILKNHRLFHNTQTRLQMSEQENGGNKEHIHMLTFNTFIQKTCYLNLICYNLFTVFV